MVSGLFVFSDSKDMSVTFTAEWVLICFCGIFGWLKFAKPSAAAEGHEGLGFLFVCLL